MDVEFDAVIPDDYPTIRAALDAVRKRIKVRDGAPPQKAPVRVESAGVHIEGGTFEGLLTVQTPLGPFVTPATFMELPPEPDAC